MFPEGSTTVAATPAGDDRVTSSGSFTGANGHTIDWFVTSEIDDGSSTLRSHLRLPRRDRQGVLRLHHYVDLDVEDFDDDVLLLSRLRGGEGISACPPTTLDSPSVAA